MVKVKSVDHIKILVRDYRKSRVFYATLMKFLGFKVFMRGKDYTGWKNGVTRFFIAKVDPKFRNMRFREGAPGYHHVGFALRNRREVNALGAFLEKTGANIIDPPMEHYDGLYYATFFRDPDGMKLEGMYYGK